MIHTLSTEVYANWLIKWKMNDSQHEAKAMAKANGSKIMITIAFVSHSWMQLNFFFLYGPSAQNRKNETKIFSAETLTANDYKSKCEFSIFQLNFETIALRMEPSKRKQLSERTSERNVQENDLPTGYTNFASYHFDLLLFIRLSSWNIY